MTDRIATLVIPIESRATVEAKAIRILLERRLTILAVNKTRVIAECRGNSDRTYHLGWTHDRWHCHCDSKGKCSHLTALQMVTMRPEPE